MYNKEGTVVDGIQVRTLYTVFLMMVSITLIQKPILEPGVYTETVYTLGSNYAVKPITVYIQLEKKQYKLSLIIIFKCGNI